MQIHDEQVDSYLLNVPLEAIVAAAGFCQADLQDVFAAHLSVPVCRASLHNMAVSLLCLCVDSATDSVTSNISA